MKYTFIAIVVAIMLIGGALIFTQTKNNSVNYSNENASESGSESNVIMENGKQIILLRARGGYQPRITTAKSGLPTLIRFDTRGTFDCSSYVRIPTMNISKALPQTGTTDIDIGIAKLGVLNGTCGMGMYPFQVRFE